MKPSERFRSLAEYWCERHDVPIDVVWPQIGAESAYNPLAESEANCRGLMQLSDDTAAMFHCRDWRDADENIRCGTTWDATILYKFVLPITGQDRRDPDALRFMLVGYNAGPGYVVATLKSIGDHNWATFSSAFKGIMFKGKKPDWKQALGYAEKIIPL